MGIHATPLLAGLQSLLGDSKVLTLHGPHSREAISIEHGAVVEHFGWGNTQVDERLDEPVPLQQATAPVALLVDRGTNGAGEGVSIAFTGRRHTCFLGERMAGATEWGPVESFSDGAVLVIMSEQIEDRQGHPYPEGLTPQILLDQPAAIPDVMADSGINTAKIWLDTQLPECQPHTQ